MQKNFQSFWAQWKSDYLNQIQVRDKWCTKKAEIDVGDLVMIKEETLPATKWHMGRVVEKHAGSDDQTRV